MRHFSPIDHDRWGSGWDTVAYHANCSDGLAAAAVVAQYLDSWIFRYPKFVPIAYGSPLPAEILEGGDRILFVDFCPEPEQIKQIAFLFTDWFVIDHHKSREWVVDKYPNNCVFDMDKCGATLAWEWLYDGSDNPTVFGHRVLPSWVLDYVQDRDLWQWRLPSSREVSAALRDWEPNVETWQRNMFEAPIPSAELVSTGRIILRQVERYAKARAQKCYPGVIAGMPVLLCNATQHMSEVAEQILESNPLGVAAVFWQDGREQLQFSFRSRPGGKWTALAVASALGGGGHEHAAGAKTTPGLLDLELEGGQL